MFDWLWALFTVTAAAAQTARNTLQRGLTERLGTVGATHVRFLYGMPFAALFLMLVSLAVDDRPPPPSLSFIAWCCLGAVAQILATALMLAAMRARSFVVTIAYTKTEPVQVALFAVVVLGETLTPLMVGAILIATAGVMIMSWPTGEKAADALSWRPAVLGIAAGGMFALAAVGFRGAILELGATGATSFVLAATTTLAWGLAIQAAGLSAWLALRDRAVLVDVLKAWRISAVAGFMGAFASQMWFLAFALEQVARVRTLGLVEVLFAWAVSRNVLKQPTTGREVIGMVMVVAGVTAVVNG
jgi:drug/metabolite transporter (DMT)-like permease